VQSAASQDYPKDNNCPKHFIAVEWLKHDFVLKTGIAVNFKPTRHPRLGSWWASNSGEFD